MIQHNAKEAADLSFLRAAGMMEEEEREAVERIIQIKEGEKEKDNDEEEERAEEEQRDEEVEKEWEEENKGEDAHKEAGMRADSGFSESPLKIPGSVEFKTAKRIKTEPCAQLIEEEKNPLIKASKTVFKCAFCRRVCKGRADLYSHYSIKHFR